MILHWPAGSFHSKPGSNGKTLFSGLSLLIFRLEGDNGLAKGKDKVCFIYEIRSGC